MSDKKSSNQPQKKSKLNFIIIALVMILLITSCLQKFVNPNVETVTIEKWKGGAKGAYSIIHDDLCDPSCTGLLEYADTIASNRDIHLGFGALVSECVAGGDSLWNRMKEVVNNNHEIISHSWKHGSSVKLDWTPAEWSNDTDVIYTKKILEEKLNTEVSFFIFPYDAYDSTRINELKEAGYLGARAGKKLYEDRAINTRFSEFDPLRVNFDAYMSKAEQTEIDNEQKKNGEELYNVSIYNNDSISVAIQHLKGAIATEGWSLQEMHSVDDSKPWGWGHISVNDYRELLDLAVAKRKTNELWIDNPTDVAKYIVTRNGLGEVSVKGKEIKFSGIDSYDKKYATEITMLLNTSNNPSTVNVYQNNKKLDVVKVSENKFRVNANPKNGKISYTAVK